MPICEKCGEEKTEQGIGSHRKFCKGTLQKGAEINYVAVKKKKEIPEHIEEPVIPEPVKSDKYLVEPKIPDAVYDAKLLKLSQEVKEFKDKINKDIADIQKTSAENLEILKNDLHNIIDIEVLKEELLNELEACDTKKGSNGKKSSRKHGRHGRSPLQIRRKIRQQRRLEKGF